MTIEDLKSISIGEHKEIVNNLIDNIVQLENIIEEMSVRIVKAEIDLKNSEREKIEWSRRCLKLSSALGKLAK